MVISSCGAAEGDPARANPVPKHKVRAAVTMINCFFIVSSVFVLFLNRVTVPSFVSTVREKTIQKQTT